MLVEMLSAAVTLAAMSQVATTPAAMTQAFMARAVMTPATMAVLTTEHQPIETIESIKNQNEMLQSMLKEKNAEINEILSKNDHALRKAVDELQNEKTEREKEKREMKRNIQKLTEALSCAQRKGQDANGKLDKKRKSLKKKSKTCKDLKRTVAELKSEIENIKKKKDSDTQEISRLRKQVRVLEKTIAEMKANGKKIAKEATTKKNLRLEQERKEWKVREVTLKSELYTAKNTKPAVGLADKQVLDEMKSTKKELEIARKEIRILKSNPSQICTCRFVNRVASSTSTSFGGNGDVPNQMVSKVKIEPGIEPVQLNNSFGSVGDDVAMDEDDDCQIIAELKICRVVVPIKKSISK